MKKLIKATIKTNPKKTTITLTDVDKELKVKLIVPSGQCFDGKPMDTPYIKMLQAFLEDQEKKAFNKELNLFLKEMFDELED